MGARLAAWGQGLATLGPNLGQSPGFGDSLLMLRELERAPLRIAASLIPRTAVPPPTQQVPAEGPEETVLPGAWPSP